jgi:hypothetical protein
MLGNPIDIPSASADACPGSEAVFARGTNEHRKLHRPREVRARPVAKRLKAKPIAAGHTPEVTTAGNRAPRANY